MKIFRVKPIKFSGDNIDSKTKEIYEKIFQENKKYNPISKKIEETERAFYIADFDMKKAMEIATQFHNIFGDEPIFSCREFQLIEKDDFPKYDKYIDMENEPNETNEQHTFKKKF